MTQSSLDDNPRSPFHALPPGRHPSHTWRGRWWRLRRRVDTHAMFWISTASAISLWLFGRTFLQAERAGEVPAYPPISKLAGTWVLGIRWIGAELEFWIRQGIDLLDPGRRYFRVPLGEQLRRLHRVRRNTPKPSLKVEPHEGTEGH